MTKNLKPANLRGIDIRDTAKGRNKNELIPLINPKKHPPMK